MIKNRENVYDTKVCIHAKFYLNFNCFIPPTRSIGKQVLANKDASPFLCCFVVVVVGHGCYGGCGLRHCCGGYLDACELLLSLLLIFFIGKD